MLDATGTTLPRNIRPFADDEPAVAAAGDAETGRTSSAATGSASAARSASASAAADTVAAANVAKALTKAPPAVPAVAAKPAESPGFFAQIGAFFSGLASGIGRIVGSVAMGIMDTIMTIPRAISGGAKSVGQFFGKLAVAVVTTVLMPVKILLKAVQQLAGWESTPRRLAESETALARKIFGKTIALEGIAVHDGPSGILGANDRPLALGRDIYLKDESKKGPSKYRARVMHELTHAWQHQQVGFSYVMNALGGQMSDNKYHWEAGMNAHRSFHELNPEQQGQLIEDAVEAGWFDDNDAETKPFIHNDKDCTAYLKAALEEIRNGRGA